MNIHNIKIKNFIKSMMVFEEGSYEYQIVKDSNLSPQAIRYFIKGMEHAGLLAKMPKGKRNILALTHKGRIARKAAQDLADVLEIE